MSALRLSRLALALAASSLVSLPLASCSSTASSSPVPALGYDRIAAAAGGASPIKHVIIMIQENRTFDNFFATFPGADGATSGLCGKKTIPLRAVGLVGGGVSNDHKTWETEYDHGKMDGFCRAVQGNHSSGGLLPYQYVYPSQVRPLWAIAKQYVLAEYMFQTQTSASFTAHQDLIRGDTVLNATESVVDNLGALQWGCGAPLGARTSLLTSSGRVLDQQGPFPCFTWKTLRDSIEAKHLSWKYYSPSVRDLSGGNLWNAFYAIRAVYADSTELRQHISVPETTIFRDIKRGTLPAVSWVVPDFFNSDHPQTAHDTGPSWVAQVVNAVGANTPLWNSTAIVVVWDDWGGFYDHVSPPQLDYNGLGFRVPCLIVSPYAKPHYISKTQYEFGSILRFVEDTFGLERLGTTDVRATSIGDSFDYGQKPRRFVPIAAKYPLTYFEHETPSNHPLDDL
jgi:phospholipase C